MIFAGLQKLTLLDYPGHTACTVFTQGCDYRCPFCHNASLLPVGVAPDQPIDEEEILSFLRKRQGTLDGVCITGGEPLLHPELRDFIVRVRELGFGLKLDTNGNHPEYLRSLIEEDLLTMVAMDIKNSPAHYARTIGLPAFDLGPVRESAALLMEGRIPYEFRTTVVDELHEGADFEAVGQWIAGAKRYFLQSFTDREAVPFGGLHAPSKEKLREYREIAAKYVPETRLRGVD